MPIIPSDVDGTNPGDGLSIDVTGKRLRELCEVLLTARAKMLGLSQSMGHRFSSLPENLKSSLVNGLGEIVAHLDSFEIKLGDTRLTGKVKLGVDAGMETHFPEEGISADDVMEAWVGSPSEVRHRTVIDTRRPRELVDGSAPVRKRRGRHGAEVDKRRAERLFELAREEKARVAAEVSLERAREDFPDPRDPPREKGLYGHAMSRRRRGLSSHDLSPLEHGVLVWACLSVFADVEPPRPRASFEQRLGALRELERMGYVRGVEDTARWAPTPAGFEASGLLGRDGTLEIDP